MPPSSPARRPVRAAAATSRAALAALNGSGSRSNVATAGHLTSVLSEKDPPARTRAKSKMPSELDESGAKAKKASSRTTAMRSLPSAEPGLGSAKGKLQMTTQPPRAPPAAKRKAQGDQADAFSKRTSARAGPPPSKRRLLDDGGEDIGDFEDGDAPPSAPVTRAPAAKKPTYGRNAVASTSRRALPADEPGEQATAVADEEELEFINEQLEQAAMEESLKDIKEAAREQQERQNRREAGPSKQQARSAPSIPRELLPEATFGDKEAPPARGRASAADDDDMEYVDTGAMEQPLFVIATPSQRKRPSPSNSDKENQPPPSLSAALVGQPSGSRRGSLTSLKATPRRGRPLEPLSPSVRSASRTNVSDGRRRIGVAPMHSTPHLRPRVFAATSSQAISDLPGQYGIGTPSRASLSFNSQGARATDLDFELHDHGLDVSGFTEDWKEPESPPGSIAGRRHSLMDVLEPGPRRARSRSRSRASSLTRGLGGAPHLRDQEADLGVLPDDTDDLFGIHAGFHVGRQIAAAEQYHKTREERARDFAEEQARRGSLGQSQRQSHEPPRPPLERRISRASSIGDRTGRRRPQTAAPRPSQPREAASTRSPSHAAPGGNRRGDDEDLTKSAYSLPDPAKPSHDPLRLWRYAGPVEALLPFDDFCALSEAKHQEEDRLERERRAKLRERLTKAKESEEREKRASASRREGHRSRTPAHGLALRMGGATTAPPPPSGPSASGLGPAGNYTFDRTGDESPRPIRRFLKGNRTLALSPPAPPTDGLRTRGYDLTDLPPWETHLGARTQEQPARPHEEVAESGPGDVNAAALSGGPGPLQALAWSDDDGDSFDDAASPAAVQGAIFGGKGGVDVFASFYDDDASSEKGPSQVHGSDSDGLAYKPTLPRLRRSARTKGRKAEGEGDEGSEDEVEQRKGGKTQPSQAKSKVKAKAKELEEQEEKLSVDQLVDLLPWHMRKSKIATSSGKGKAAAKGRATAKGKGKTAAAKKGARGKQPTARTQKGVERNARQARRAAETGSSSSDSDSESDESEAESAAPGASDEEEGEEEEASFFDEIPKARGGQAGRKKVTQRASRRRGKMGKKGETDTEVEGEQEEGEGKELTPRTRAKQERIALFKDIDKVELVEELAIE